jgi:acetoin utilization protein AcuB
MTIRATQVSDIMTPDPRAIEPSAKVREAYATMKENGFRHLPVVDDGRLVGVISVTDVGRLGATVSAILDKSVAEAMTPNPRTIAPEEPIESAAAQMGLYKVNCLPVVTEGRLIGIVTTYDLLDALVRRLVPRSTRAPARSTPGDV